MPTVARQFVDAGSILSADQRFVFRQGRGVGGSTAINNAVIFNPQGFWWDENIVARWRKAGARLDFSRLRASIDEMDRASSASTLEERLLTDAARLVRPALELEGHRAETMRMARRDAVLIKDAVRREPRANELFMKLLTGRNDPETVLRWMNEAGVFGRFIPEFGKVTAQMQFDMYHHYTVDEHTIRAIGLLAQIERGELSDDHPLASEIVKGSLNDAFILGVD